MIKILNIFFIACFTLYSPIVFYLLTKLVIGDYKFTRNYDFNNPKLTWHNSMHIVLTFLLTLTYGFPVGYFIMFAYEITDGIKPDDSKFKYDENCSKLFNKLKNMWLFSNNFSEQDAFIWNAIGAVSGLLINLIINGGF